MPKIPNPRAKIKIFVKQKNIWVPFSAPKGFFIDFLDSKHI